MTKMDKYTEFKKHLMQFKRFKFVVKNKQARINKLEKLLNNDEIKLYKKEFKTFAVDKMDVLVTTKLLYLLLGISCLITSTFAYLYGKEYLFLLFISIFGVIDSLIYHIIADRTAKKIINVLRLLDEYDLRLKLRKITGKTDKK